MTEETFVLKKMDEQKDSLTAHGGLSDPHTPIVGERSSTMDLSSDDQKEKEKKEKEPRYSKRERKAPQLFGNFARTTSLDKITRTASVIAAEKEQEETQSKGTKRKRVVQPKKTSGAKPNRKKRAKKQQDKEEEEVISSKVASLKKKPEGKRGQKAKEKEKKEKEKELKEEKDSKEGKEEKESKEGKKEQKEKKEPRHVVPLVNVTDFKAGTICAKMMLGRVTKTEVWDNKIYYKPLRDADPSSEWWLRSSGKTEMVSTTRYRQTIDLNKTDMAKKFMECTVFPMRVSFRPIANAESVGEQMKKYLNEFKEEKITDKEFKQLMKKVMHVPERTIDCILLEKNNALGYSLVDDLKDPAEPGKPHIKTVAHSDIQEIVFLETRYRLKGTKFQDPELEFIQ